MRFYYDTEFIERGPDHPIELISIGFVAEDGRELYAVSSELDAGALHANRWLSQNVWPTLPHTKHPGGRRCRCIHGHLDLDHPDVRSRAQIARAVARFILGDTPGQVPHVELWADYGAYDHVVLCQLFGSMVDLPAGMPMFTHDLQQEIDRLGVRRGDLPQQATGLHNALDDARHARVLGEHLAAIRAQAEGP